MLDVGCGNGAFLNFIASGDQSIELHGIDLSNAGKDVRITFHQGDFLAFDLGRQFDAIVSLAVIEHLADVRAFVRRIYQLLNRRGLAYVMTLNEDSVLYRVANFLRVTGFSGPFVRLYDVHHLNHFSQQSLIRLLTEDGLFRVDRIIDHNAPIAAMDIPGRNAFVRWVLRIAVAAMFFVGRLTGRTYLQTVVVSKAD